MAIEAQASAADGGGESRRELRLGLVLYGGVSLCVYMHGTTKEINHLVSASAMLAAGGEAGTTSSGAVYGELLERMAAEKGVRTDVVVDVIAGTSAGGINGVYLAKALAGNLSQDRLRDLWLQRADIKGMLRGWRGLPLFLRAAYVLLSLRRRAPLRGDAISVWLYEALVAMDRERPASSTLTTLMPRGSELDLLVTMTDVYGYDRQVVISDPKVVHDEQHRHVFRFCHSDRESRFAAADNTALAFAARATSCFPGAFEPVSRPLFYRYLGAGAGVIDDSLFRIYALSGASADETFFMDGGVLDNRPFAPAIKAIRSKPAAVDIERRLLYLDPDPAAPTKPAPGISPGTIPTLVGAVSGLPRKQSILDSLLETDQLNARVREVRDVIETSFAHVADLVEGSTTAGLEGGVDPAALSDRQRELHVAAREQSGTAYATYVRAKIAGVLGGLAKAACTVRDYPTESNQAMLATAVLQRWARERGLFADALPPSATQLDFLKGLDAEYAQRRARFALGAINWYYARIDEPGYPSRVQLDRVKARLWSEICELRDAVIAGIEALNADVTACFPEQEMTEFLLQCGLDAGGWAERKHAELDNFTRALADRLGPLLDDRGRRLYEDLLELAGDWSAERRRELLVRYLGFAFWDVQLYPLETVAGAGEGDAIEVIRMSPLDATLLSVKGDGPKLKGVSFGHFGAFFKRAWRENDYLIGRLDGAERLITILLGQEDPARRKWCGMAFLAILDEEEPVLKTVGPLIGRLRTRSQELARDAKRS